MRDPACGRGRALGKKAAARRAVQGFFTATAGADAAAAGGADAALAGTYGPGSAQGGVATGGLTSLPAFFMSAK